MKILYMALLSTIFIGCSTSSNIRIASPLPTTTISEEEYQTLVQNSANNISQSKIYEHISFLASDDLLGRDTPSPGLETAADYIANQLMEAGLEPLGDNNSFIQRFPYVSTTMSKQFLAFNYTTPDGPRMLEYAKDYWVIPGQEVASETEVIFGGYAGNPISDLNQEAANKVVLFTTTGNPVTGDGEELLSAFQSAAQARAAAIVFLLDDTNTADSILDLASGLAGAGLATPIPIIGLSNPESQKLLETAGIPYPISPGQSTQQSAITLSEIRMNVSAPFEVSEHTPPNVVALLPGSDPQLRDEYIVYSAHFDHVGVGIPSETGDSLYNGADDNASGTSVLLETASAFSRLPQSLARSIIFLAVSGEEKGLLGSKHFSENPTVPLEDIIMNINLDMVGRNPQPDTVIGVGKQYTNLGQITDEVLLDHPELGITVIEDPEPEDQLFFRSDHLHFINKDIPAIFFTGGEHPDYHKPSDESDKIDFEKTTRLARMVFYLGARIATGAASPEWTEEGLKEVRRIIAESGGN